MARTPQFFLTADIVLFSHDRRHILLIRRKRQPFQDHWALPGGHVDPGESSRNAAARECHEETGINLNLATATLIQVGTWDTPGRDPRGHYVTVAYAATLLEEMTPTAGDDAAHAEWISVDKVFARLLAFDHRDIITEALRLTSRENASAWD